MAHCNYIVLNIVFIIEFVVIYKLYLMIVDVLLKKSVCVYLFDNACIHVC